MTTTDEHFVFGLDGEYFVLTPEETFTMAMRGLKKQPLGLTEFSQPIDHQSLLGFLHNKTRPIHLDAGKIQMDSFWELMLEILKDYNITA